VQSIYVCELSFLFGIDVTFLPVFCHTASLSLYNGHTEFSDHVMSDISQYVSSSSSNRDYSYAELAISVPTHQGCQAEWPV